MSKKRYSAANGEVVPEKDKKRPGILSTKYPIYNPKTLRIAQAFPTKEKRDSALMNINAACGYEMFAGGVWKKFTPFAKDEAPEASITPPGLSIPACFKNQIKLD